MQSTPMNKTYKRQSEKGFTIVEAVVGLLLFSFLIIIIASTYLTIQIAQYNAQSIDLANAAAKRLVEDTRNGKFNTVTAGNTYTRTDVIPEGLENGQAIMTVSQSTDAPGLKKLDIEVRYGQPGNARSVYTSAIIGKEGIVQ